MDSSPRQVGAPFWFAIFVDFFAFYTKQKTLKQISVIPVVYFVFFYSLSLFCCCALLPSSLAHYFVEDFVCRLHSKHTHTVTRQNGRRRSFVIYLFIIMYIRRLISKLIILFKQNKRRRDWWNKIQQILFLFLSTHNNSVRWEINNSSQFVNKKIEQDAQGKTKKHDKTNER